MSVAPRAYLVGVPGAGKSTLMRHLTASVPYVLERRPLAHLVYLGEGRATGVQLGAPHEAYGGTDRLSMSVQPTAVEFVTWLAVAAPEVAVIAEGDRLANGRFLDALGGDLVWLDTPEDEAQRRRAGRGSHQNERWLAGRATKVRRLVGHRPHVRLDGSLPPAELTAAALAAVPAFRAIRADQRVDPWS